jgi:hypothetical protein
LVDHQQLQQPPLVFHLQQAYRQKALVQQMLTISRT